MRFLGDAEMKFDKGDKVRYSDLGIKNIFGGIQKYQREGKVIGYGGNGKNVRVLWDGRKTPESYHPDYIELRENTRK